MYAPGASAGARSHERYSAQHAVPDKRSDDCRMLTSVRQNDRRLPVRARFHIRRRARQRESQRVSQQGWAAGAPSARCRRTAFQSTGSRKRGIGPRVQRCAKRGRFLARQRSSGSRSKRITRPIRVTGIEASASDQRKTVLSLTWSISATCVGVGRPAAST